jgi:hypothetical protein
MDGILRNYRFSSHCCQLVTIALLLCANCATVGRDFPVARVSDIRIGETTQTQIREMFGAPWRVGTEQQE